MINLFEYRNKEAFKGDFEGLELFLDDIWNKRERYISEEDEGNTEVQRFIQFIHKTKELKSNKYVGVIHFNGERINLFPKIFHDDSSDCNEVKIEGIQKHILWYLSYCRKLKFPNYQSSLGVMKNDFFEVIIYLFAKYTRELLNNSIYQQYEEISREVHNIKGRLNVSRYINENLSRGRWHKVNCDYDAFVIDNKFNRIIKYVAKLLFYATKNAENKRYLREILFVLDDVSDEVASASECRMITFNPMFGAFETVRDYCQLFLENSISINYKNELKLFAFLLPMEYLFEDFIFGFIDKEIEVLKAKAQSTSIYLDESEVFGLKPDLCISSPDKEFIADTKYKIIYSDSEDAKKGISQSDLYQMVAYAIRFNVPDIVLLYPNTVKEYIEDDFRLNVVDRLSDGRLINIKTFQLPIINHELLNIQQGNTIDLEECFSSLKVDLKLRLEKIFEVDY